MKEGFVTHRTPAKVRRVQMISSQCHFSPTKQMAKRAVKTGLVKTSVFASPTGIYGWPGRAEKDTWATA